MPFLVAVYASILVVLSPLNLTVVQANNRYMYFKGLYDGNFCCPLRKVGMLC